MGVEAPAGAEVPHEAAAGDLLALMVAEVEDYAILLLDQHGVVVSWNAGAARIKGYRAAEIIGRHFSVFYPPEEQAAGVPQELLREATRAGRVEREGWRLRRDGSRFWANVVITALRGPDGELRGFGKVTRDLTERHLAELDLRASEERFRVAFTHAAVPICTVSLEEGHVGEILSANPAYAELVGRPAELLVGARLEELVHPDDLESGCRVPLRRLASGEVERVQSERRFRRPDGEIISTLVNNAAFTDERGRRVAIGQVLDISERKRFETQLLHLADHDSLTGLFNRRRFEDELRRVIGYASRAGGGGALLSLDLDGFKHITDSLGHPAGDELVVSLADAAKCSLRPTDVIARTGGDEFAVLLPSADEHAAVEVAERLLAAVRLAGAETSDHRHVQVTASIGITLFRGGDCPDAADLLAEADRAMYDAKVHGKDCVRVYHRDEEQRDRHAVRENWLARLQGALAEERFILHAQPIVALHGQQLPHYELLLRLPDEQEDLIAPGTFLYDAERYGLIEEIDRWVMERAVRLLHEHHRNGDDLSLAFNISARTLNAGGVAEDLTRLIERYPIPRDRLTVEITETAAITNIERARALGREIRALGCKLALDDFGAGFATFYYLKHLDFDYIKIDGEFIHQLCQNRTDQLVVQAVVDVARGLGSDTIAEFVPDDSTATMLRELGVGFGQGYHLGRPGPLGERLPVLAG